MVGHTAADAGCLSRRPEVIPWTLFKSTTLWDASQQSPQQTVRGALRLDLEAAVDATLRQLNGRPAPAGSGRRHRTLTRDHLLDGRYRHRPGVGSEYVLRFVGPGSPGIQTVRLMRPAGPLTPVGRSSVAPATVRLVVPYYHNPHTFSAFLVNVAHLILERHEPLELDVVFYWRGTPAAEPSAVAEDRKRVAEALRQLNRHAGRTVAHMVDENRDFSRGHGLLRGAQRPGDYGGDVLLFFCDIDMFIDSEALSRCRTNAAPGRSVYYPIVFSTYNPALLASVLGKSPVSPWKEHPISKDVGFWRDFGFGMTCQYRSDFQRVAGDYLVSNKWGGEDIQLFRHHQVTDIEVVRAPDPGLVHVYHGARCNTSLGPESTGWCGASQLSTEASADTYARLFLKLRQLWSSQMELNA